MNTFIHFILHIDTYLAALVSHYGIATYVIMFVLIFCETGLVVTPFLPGDSLVFALGAFCAAPNQPLHIVWMGLLLISASILGNQVNYFIGRFFGLRLAASRWIKPHYLAQTTQFYQKHGGKTLILARFMPIVRTFAPFVAGMSAMPKKKFYAYNIFSAVLWMGSLITLGYFFGSLPIVKEHFTGVIYGIILISVLPSMIAVKRGFCRAKARPI